MPDHAIGVPRPPAPERTPIYDRLTDEWLWDPLDPRQREPSN